MHNIVYLFDRNKQSMILYLYRNGWSVVFHSVSMDIHSSSSDALPYCTTWYSMLVLWTSDRRSVARAWDYSVFYLHYYLRITSSISRSRAIACFFARFEIRKCEPHGSINQSRLVCMVGSVTDTHGQFIFRFLACCELIDRQRGSLKATKAPMLFTRISLRLSHYWQG